MGKLGVAEEEVVKVSILDRQSTGYKYSLLSLVYASVIRGKSIQQTTPKAFRHPRLLNRLSFPCT